MNPTGRRSSISFLQRTLAWCVLSLFFLVPSAHAQFGLAFTYGTDTEIGGQISSYHAINTDVLEGLDGLRVGADLAVYAPQSLGTVFDVYFFELNTNAHYDLTERARARVYAVGGIHYGYALVTAEDGQSALFSNEGDFGLNLGVGGQFGLRRGLFGELKYTLGGFSQLGLTTGVRF